ncbi:transmembrane protein 214-A isoform X2 [Orussus abietinus]|uniref:transmembrane protein 214-A isoform X2 n=1 Tax=Orussus abietinus TaxID=222816 RepID=UPI000625ADC0|nr:transmembrane protein 214-A isoform X2 [Orussus abietinus]
MLRRWRTSENKKPVKEKESKTKENEEKKKQQRQQQLQQQQQADKKKTERKEKPPKTIEEAVKRIDANELQNLLDTDQVRFPDAPLIWLKDLLAFLNVKIPVERDDPLFSDKPENYPLCVLPNSIKSTLERALEAAGTQNTQLFYEVTLISMASDIMKGVPVVGCKIFLQLMGYHWPEIALVNASKLISLRNSYQNRKSIGLSFIWTILQSGRKDLSIGLKLWHEVMAPMIEMKSYAVHVAKILNDLIFIYGNTKDISADLYFTIIDDVYSGKFNVPVSVEKDILSATNGLRNLMLKNGNINHGRLFDTLLGRLVNGKKTSVSYREEILNSLAACLSKDVNCYTVWKSVYAKHLYQSNLLLKHLESNWDILYPNLKTKALSETLSAFQTYNESKTKSKGRDEHLGACAKQCEILTRKMTVSQRRFPWKKGSLLLLVLIGAVLAFDCQRHGSFKASSTGRFLKESGAIEHAQRVWSTAKVYSNSGLEFIEASSPEYYKIAVTWSSSYVKLFGDVYLVIRNISGELYNNTVEYVHIKGPEIAAKIDHYIPGVLEDLDGYRVRVIELIKTYSAVIADGVVEQSRILFQWLESNVFTGKLSAENLQSYATRAIDKTHTLASQTYDWVYEKVQTFSKVQ